jgi:hypothetical protein
MEYAYRVDAWQALYTAVAGATAALTGLLFIALSLDLPTVMQVPAYRARGGAQWSLQCTLCFSSRDAIMLKDGS